MPAKAFVHSQLLNQHFSKWFSTRLIGIVTEKIDSFDKSVFRKRIWSSDGVCQVWGKRQVLSL